MDHKPVDALKPWARGQAHSAFGRADIGKPHKLGGKSFQTGRRRLGSTAAVQHNDNLAP